MTWLTTSQGREHHLCAPQATQPCNVPTLAEIAHSLAHINRFTGHASRAYSVAEHSLLVQSIAKHEFGADAGGQLAALMHDAHECIVGDVASPIKQALGPVWHEFEAMHEQHLRAYYGLSALYAERAAMVKRCDLIALATERRDLMLFDALTSTPWPILDTEGQRVYPSSLHYLCSTDILGPSGSNPGDWANRFKDTARVLLAKHAETQAAV